MADVSIKLPPPRCHVCRAWFDVEDLFCHNCGTEAPPSLDPQGEHGKPVRLADRTPSALAFRCTACGASMNYDASARALRCPFCGNQQLERQAAHRTLRPEVVIPLQLDRAGATRRLQAFLGSSFWHPSDLATSAAIHQIVPIYFPAWLFNAATQTHFTADSSATPPRASGDWCPVYGTHATRYENILVPASFVLSEGEIRDIEPYELSQGEPTERVNLEEVTVEEFQVPQRSARSLARRAIEHYEHQACIAQVAGKVRNLRVNVLLSDIRGKPALLPVWILAYTYRGTIYRVLVNGQSGKISGKAPFSVWKLFGVIAAGIILLIMVGILGLLFASN